MKPFHVSIALFLACALFLFGCPSEMEPPPVCSNLCPPGQTQAAYPNCECSGSEYDPGTGGVSGYCTNMCPPGYAHYGYPDCTCYGTGVGGMGDIGDLGGMGGANVSGGLGGTGGMGVPNVPPISIGDSGGSGGYSWGTSNIGSQEDILLTGGPASPSTSYGMLLVLLTATNSDEIAYDGAEISIGSLSAYRAGVGGGWELLQGGVKNYSLKHLDGRLALIGRGRIGIGGQTRILLELRNVTVSYGDEAYPVRAPKSMYAFVSLVPLRASGTSAVTLNLDLTRTFTVSEDGFTYFTPAGDITSTMGVTYLVKDDGATEVSGGRVMLREDFAVNATGDSIYVVVDGITANCMDNCIDECPAPYSAVCHAACAQHCAGAPSEFETACFDGTQLNSCSTINKPYYCGPDGDFSADCKNCGCPVNQVCKSDGLCVTAEVKVCSDGTLPNRCSGTNKPNYCSGDGKMIQLCTVCGCPSGKICRSDGRCG